MANITGDDTNNSLIGTAGNDSISALGGNDTLDGIGGNDSLNGGTGDDTYTFGAGWGNDTVKEAYTGRGNDTLVLPVASSDVTFTGTFRVVPAGGFIQIQTIDLLIAAGANSIKVDSEWYWLRDLYGEVFSETTIESIQFTDRTVHPLTDGLPITGSAAGELLAGFDGPDTIDGLGGNDGLYGRLGDDVLRGGAGDDTLRDSTGYYDSNASNDSMYGDDGNDTLDGEAGSDYLDGGAGNDRLVGSPGADLRYGNAGDDTFELSASDGTWGTMAAINRHMVSSAGVPDQRTITGRVASQDALDGGDGYDSVYGSGTFGSTSSYDDVLFYTDVNQPAHTAANAAARLASIEYFDLGAGDDVLDMTNGSGGYPTSFTALGGDGSDALWGGLGDDTLDGGAGDKDFLTGGPGSDRLTGGAGKDIFGFSRNFGADVVTDFENGQDNIRLKGFGAAYDTYTEVRAAIVQQGADAVLTLAPAGQSVVTVAFLNTDVSVFDPSDFTIIA